MHLHKIAQYSERTGMTDRNLAIVWAPNLLRSPALEAGGKFYIQIMLQFTFLTNVVFNSKGLLRCAE